MFVVGSVLVSLTALKPHVTMLSTDFSWLPLIGLFLVVVGLLCCLDGIKERGSPRFHYHLQVGVFDCVVGVLIFFSVGREPAKLALLIAGYLITQGLVRLILSFTVPLRNPASTRVGGGLSLLLGILIWTQWPSHAAWFLSLALSVEIAARGWALIQLGAALADQSVERG